MKPKRTEDLLSMARRHVVEGEAHVARQEALIVKLDRDGHTELAVEAREILTTLQTSLQLQRDDLFRGIKSSMVVGGTTLRRADICPLEIQNTGRAAEFPDRRDGDRST
jgi:hypothetical protein